MEGAQRQQRLRSLQRPDHAGLLEALADDGLAAALDYAGADEPPVPPVFVVLHPAEIAAVVPVLAHGVLAEPCLHVLPDVVQHVPCLPRLYAFRPVVVAVLPFLRAFPDPKPEHHRLQMPYRVVDVEDRGREREVVPPDGLQPLASVGDVERRLRNLAETPVELRADDLPELLRAVRRRDVARRADVAVRLVVRRRRRPEDRGSLDLARLRAPVLAHRRASHFIRRFRD